MGFAGVFCVNVSCLQQTDLNRQTGRPNGFCKQTGPPRAHFSVQTFVDHHAHNSRKSRTDRLDRMMLTKIVRVSAVEVVVVAVVPKWTKQLSLLGNVNMKETHPMQNCHYFLNAVRMNKNHLLGIVVGGGCVRTNCWVKIVTMRPKLVMLGCDHKLCWSTMHA